MAAAKEVSTAAQATTRIAKRENKRPAKAFSTAPDKGASSMIRMSAFKLPTSQQTEIVWVQALAASLGVDQQSQANRNLGRGHS